MEGKIRSMVPLSGRMRIKKPFPLQAGPPSRSSILIGQDGSATPHPTWAEKRVGEPELSRPRARDATGSIFPKMAKIWLTFKEESFHCGGKIRLSLWLVRQVQCRMGGMIGKGVWGDANRVLKKQTAKNAENAKGVIRCFFFRKS
jgi:hypothetical protein